MNNLNFKAVNPRRLVFYAAVWIAFLFLSGAFFNLQILQGNLYRRKSRENSVKIESQIPVRGLIYDRNENLIADNRPSFSLYLVPALTSDSTIDYVSKVLHIETSQIRKKFNNSRRFQPIKIARYVDLPTLVLLQENKLDLPGLEWKAEPKRNYEYSYCFAHILGTLGEIDEHELNKHPEYELGDVVGKKGIEKSLDTYLRGHKGYRYVKVDALGRTVEEISSEKNSQPYPGNDLYLTVDARLQQYADSLFGNRNGAFVAIDVRSGEILTLLSKPYYNLNLFAEAVQPAVWSELMADSLNPLFDRASQATYPPGSSFKMVAAIAALNEDIVSPQWTINCPGYYRIGRRVVHCWNAKGHGEVNLEAAIKYSCNVYFYQLGLKIGIDHWSKYSRIFRFGSKTGVELVNEKSGLVPSKEFYDRIYGKGRWTKGMLANIAIGQGELLVTPLQMGQFAMILANSGEYYQPHLAKKLVDKITGKEIYFSKTLQKVEAVKPEVFELIREAMHQVVAGGTGWRAGVWRIPTAGKTGTAQNPHGNSHAWYIGFAPYENPQIALAVILENGGSGGAVAAPIVGKYLRRYFYYRGEFDYQEELKMLRAQWTRQQEQARLDSLRGVNVLSSEDSTIQIIGNRE